MLGWWINPQAKSGHYKFIPKKQGSKLWFNSVKENDSCTFSQPFYTGNDMQISCERVLCGERN